jgi:hypothetical protein
MFDRIFLEGGLILSVLSVFVLPACPYPLTTFIHSQPYCIKPPTCQPPRRICLVRSSTILMRNHDPVMLPNQVPGKKIMVRLFAPCFLCSQLTNFSTDCELEAERKRKDKAAAAAARKMKQAAIEEDLDEPNTATWDFSEPENEQCGDVLRPTRKATTTGTRGPRLVLRNLPSFLNHSPP